MERVAYILDTNVVADYINQFEPTAGRIKQAIRYQHDLYLCQPVYFEVLRGLLKTNATSKLRFFEDQFSPLLLWLPLTDADWRQAAQYWAATRSAGKQLNDVDLLIAALASRLDAVIVSNDDDFNVLPTKRENWRNP